ncbi:UNVERIFIED_CONTAM: hypothetical protein Scaly_3071900 [Sesamum calycinum]|uniref:Endonuclease/exonuclease/phosphatase domain-containing protein n=1 Tax=Sesamum calycinum TaxID=2727403 RepID=A0AAW2JUB7_9LAMI
MIKVASWNVRGLNGADHQRAVEHLVREYQLSFIGLIETRVSLANVQNVRLNFLRNWSWFEDYSGPAGRIWLAWCLISVLYGDYELIPRRELWGGLRTLAVGISDEPWLVLGDFNAVLDDSEVRGRAAIRVCRWLNFVLAYWIQRKQKGNLTENVKLAKAYLDKAQELFAVYRDDILLHLVKCCRMVYSEAIKLEMSMLKQRAKLRWMKHGDQNSRVFFRKINSKRAKHMIFQITMQLVRIIDLSFLRTELKHTLTLEEASFLIRPVTREEIKEAIFDIDEESAPGPDGTGQLLKQVNTTLLALIPKVNLPSYVSDYRPISCWRSIADNILLAQELLAGYNQRRLPPRCTIKVDIQKAYDSVEWDFLLEVLRLFNFPPRLEPSQLSYAGRVQLIRIFGTNEVHCVSFILSVQQSSTYIEQPSFLRDSAASMVLAGHN